jgi:hypothetical protein
MIEVEVQVAGEEDSEGGIPAKGEDLLGHRRTIGAGRRQVRTGARVVGIDGLEEFESIGTSRRVIEKPIVGSKRDPLAIVSIPERADQCRRSTGLIEAVQRARRRGSVPGNCVENDCERWTRRKGE